MILVSLQSGHANGVVPELNLGAMELAVGTGYQIQLNCKSELFNNSCIFSKQMQLNCANSNSWWIHDWFLPSKDELECIKESILSTLNLCKDGQYVWTLIQK